MLSTNKISQKLAEFTHLSMVKELLVPPHVFDTPDRHYSLREVKELWHDEDVATVKERKGALYIHIPFCKSRCAFCMYDSRVTHGDKLSIYVDRCRKEIEFWKEEILNPLESLYIGGGTPSILREKDLQTLLQPLEQFSFVENSSRTFELSPDTICETKLDILRDSHINRVSFGIQSLDPVVLRNVRRSNPPIDVIARLIGYARAVEFDDVNIDLMVGLEGQNVSNVLDTIKKVIAMEPLSITIYTYRAVTRENEKLTYNRIIESQNQLAAAYGIFKELGWNHIGGTIETEYNVFASPLREKNLIRHKTSIDVVGNLNLIGIGSHAIGFKPSLAYQCMSYNEDFDTESPRYEIYRHSKLQQMRLAVCNMLYHNGMTIDGETFKMIFGLNFEDVFWSEINELDSIGRLNRTNSKFKFLSNSIYEDAGIQKFFWDQDFLQKYK